MIKVKQSEERAREASGFTEEVTFQLKPDDKNHLQGCNLKMGGKGVLDKGGAQGASSQKCAKSPQCVRAGSRRNGGPR